MSEKNIKARVIHKHDTEANWNLATNFTPKQGEIIVYDVNDTHAYERFKIGDGVTNVTSLPFVTSIGISGASVGQIIKVKEVDDLGRPTAWEVAEQVQPDWTQNDSSKPDYIKNKPAEYGKTAYEIACQNGFSGTESEWLASLVGPSGATGATGNSAFVRFAYSNTGKDMTEKWNEGQSYIGFSTALQAPTDPAEYEWCQFVTPYTPSGWTSDQISLLEVILNNIAYVDTTTGQTAAVNLIESLRNRAITDDITQSGSVLTIRALANTPTQSGSVLSIT